MAASLGSSLIYLISAKMSKEHTAFVVLKIIPFLMDSSASILL